MRIDSLHSAVKGREVSCVALVVIVLAAASPLAAQTPDPETTVPLAPSDASATPPSASVAQGAPHASAAASASTPALSLTCDVSTAGMNAAALRAAIERELSVPVRL